MIPRLVVLPFICCHHLVLQHDNTRNRSQAIVPHSYKDRLCFGEAENILGEPARSADATRRVAGWLSAFLDALDSVYDTERSANFFANLQQLLADFKHKAERYFTGGKHEQSAVTDTDLWVSRSSCNLHFMVDCRFARKTARQHTFHQTYCARTKCFCKLDVSTRIKGIAQIRFHSVG